MFQCQRVRGIWYVSFNILSFLGMFQAHVGWWSYNWHECHLLDQQTPLGCLIVGYMGHQLGITNNLTLLLINQPRFIHRPLALSAHCAWGQLYNTDTENSWFPFGKWPTQFLFSMYHYIYVNLLIMMVNYSLNTPQIPKVGYIWYI